jgi:hypothetical protein
VSNSRTAAALVTALALSVARSVRGADSSAPPVSIGVVTRGCGVDLPEVRELSDRLGVELAPVRIEARSTPPLLEVSTTCTNVEALSFLDGDSSRTRPVSLEDVAPELRPVALAVLAAEFLRSIWATPQTAGAADAATTPATAEAGIVAPSPAATTVAQAPTAAATPAPATPVAPREPPTKDGAEHRRPDASKDTRLGAGPLFRYFTSGASILGGAELSVAPRPLFVAANAAFGRAQDSLGRISLGVVAGSLGGRLPLARTNQLRWWGAAAVDVGWSWATATPADAASSPRSSGTVFAALTLGPELDVPIDGGFGLTLSLRAGAARGVVATADGRQVAGAQGFTLSSSAVVHYAL